jgi:hypothetical protein
MFSSTCSIGVAAANALAVDALAVTLVANTMPSELTKKIRARINLWAGTERRARLRKSSSIKRILLGEVVRPRVDTN